MILASFLTNPEHTQLVSIISRFLVNMLVISIIIGFLYRKTDENKEFVLPIVAIGVIIFLLSSYLSIVKVELGMALGLFAIFSIIRFRTRNIRAYQMAYLFIIIGVSAINALAQFPHPIRGMIISNSLVVLSLYGLEYYQSNSLLSKRNITLSNIDLAKPSRREDLISYLRRTTELDVKSVKIKEVNYLKSEAYLIIYFKN
ncbi:DUF4956 domain-containing protein [Carboxylicivirga sp. M1479]|uniref:DUF4956 domain-containing protein n=1 Tax=Carboxylicivirga sp. M1479 TaxID=2594476 RepID=UPI0011779A6E|nr:DUF4956 domain-containing protein [Carboxylicivirga sp. M1479]TRX63979.1 DUF4956 domain-containing protein [Carboxylicivirga sp. M1479]